MSVPLKGLLALWLMAVPAAAWIPETESDPVSVTLLPGAIVEGGHHLALLQLELGQGWKTYWRVPGAVGLPPVASWDRSSNLAQATVHWPRPKLRTEAGVPVLGYSETQIFPVEIAPVAAGKPVNLVGEVRLGVCREICVPHAVEVALQLHPGESGESHGPPELQAALNRLPLSPDEARVERVSCVFDFQDRHVVVQARVTLPETGTPEIIVVESGRPDTWSNWEVAHRDGSQLVGESTITALEDGPVVLARDELVLTVIGSRSATEVRGCPPPHE